MHRSLFVHLWPADNPPPALGHAQAFRSSEHWKRGCIVTETRVRQIAGVRLARLRERSNRLLLCGHSAPSPLASTWPGVIARHPASRETDMGIKRSVIGLVTMVVAALALTIGLATVTPNMYYDMPSSTTSTATPD